MRTGDFLDNKMGAAFFIISYQNKYCAYLNSLHAVYFSCLCCLLTFSKLTFSKKSFSNTIRVSNGLDPDMDRRSVSLALYSVPEIFF